MIAVDTSAIMALLLNEPKAEDISVCMSENHLVISAGTYAELMIVSAARNINPQAKALVKQVGIAIEIIDGTAGDAIHDAYMRWGKGRNPAALNFGDCFAYVLAKQKDIPLLFIGNDFTKTDIISALKRT